MKKNVELIKNEWKQSHIEIVQENGLEGNDADVKNIYRTYS